MNLKEFSFTKNIKESEYTEGVRKHEVALTKDPGPGTKDQVTKDQVTRKKDIYHKTVVECILSEYDPMYQVIEASEKPFFLSQKLGEMCKEIDCNPDYYETFRFNPKSLSKKCIQQSLMMVVKHESRVSSLLYFNELYRQHFHLVVSGKIYETSLKSYPKIYLVKGGNGFTIQSLSEEWTLSRDPLPLHHDLKKSDIKRIFQTSLAPLSKYKVDDLRKMATEKQISLSENGGKGKGKGKGKSKQTLYENLMDLEMIE